MAESTLHSAAGWQRFWNAGGWWRAVILGVGYCVAYAFLGFIVGLVFPERGSVRGAAGSAMDVFVSIALPLVLVSLGIAIFALSIGRLRPLFARQVIRGRGWMWIGIAVVLVVTVSALLGTNFEDAGPLLVASWLLVGLGAGVAEEVLTRGLVVDLMRQAGHGEIAVALASSGVFAAFHVAAMFATGEGLSTAVLDAVYFFVFGLCMYLALRLTGNLIWPIVLHASTDFIRPLQEEHPLGGNPFSIIAAFGAYLVVATGVILLVVFLVSERRRARLGL
ncbi:MAG: CPBP family intramembrane glutamic endopeptidase [Rhodoglobus sp.]